MNRSSSKIMLIADRREPDAARGGVAIRRFRLARVRPDGSVASSPARAALKQA